VSKITRRGPTIKYKGTGSVEKFRVSVPVKHYEWLAFKAREAGTLACDSGLTGEGYLYTPALVPGGPFAAAYSTEECTQLVGATMVW
jgi:hypothetical protein